MVITLVIWKGMLLAPQGHNSVLGKSTALCSVSKMIFPPVNYFLCSLVLTLALPCARHENLELSAQVRSPQSIVAMFQFLMVVSVKTVLHGG